MSNQEHLNKRGYLSMQKRSAMVVFYPSSCVFLSTLALEKVREFKIYDAMVAKTSLKIASSSLSIFFAIISVCVTFES